MPHVRIERTTFCLQDRCTTTMLKRLLVHPRIELGFLDSKSNVLTTRLIDHLHATTNTGVEAVNFNLGKQDVVALTSF